MKLTVFMHDDLLPANHGYRVDVHRRLLALKAMGASVQLVCLSRGRGRGWSHEGGTAFADEVIVADRDAQVSSLQALLGVSSLPWPAACRKLSGASMARLLQAVRQFQPQGVLLEGLYCAPLAETVARTLSIPLYYRSHNIEHLYMRDQLKAERGLKQTLNLWLSNLHLARLEHGLIGRAAWVHDISYSDAQFWRGAGFTNVSWLPPLSAQAATGRPASTVPVAAAGGFRWDVAYCGNLNAPNNVEAIDWLLTKVLPLVRAKRADVRVVIAGSAPNDAVLRMTQQHAGIELVPNPVSIEDIYAQTKVLVNPALRGSGVNIKTIDMMSSGLPIVVSEAGAGGLSPEILRDIAVKADPSLFADKLLHALAQREQAPGSGGKTVSRLDELAHEGLAGILGVQHEESLARQI